MSKTKKRIEAFGIPILYIIIAFVGGVGAFIFNYTIFYNVWSALLLAVISVSIALPVAAIFEGFLHEVVFKTNNKE
jgi:ABC-type sulfate transport system permease subunit